MSMLKCNEILKSIYLHIDSRDRNYNNNPNSNDYIIKLHNFKIRNVKSIELISAKIPKTEYLINSNNNKIHFQENSIDYTIQLDYGNYTANTLATHLENKLNALGTSNSYTVNVNNSTGILDISRNSGSNSYSLLFSTGQYNDSYDSNGQIIIGQSPRIILGFDIADYTSNLAGSIDSPNKMNLHPDCEIFIEIDNYMGHIDTYISDNNYLKGKIFASIDMDVNNDDIKYFKNSEKKIKKEFFPLMNNLSYLHIKFKNYFNQLYNFNGQENSMLLKIEYLEKGF
jgi:hypothetical protein